MASSNAFLFRNFLAHLQKTRVLSICLFPGSRRTMYEQHLPRIYERRKLELATLLVLNYSPGQHRGSKNNLILKVPLGSYKNVPYIGFTSPTCFNKKFSELNCNYMYKHQELR